MSKDENEFIDPLEEIDPIMREAFTENTEEPVAELESDLDDMLNSLENDADLNDLSLTNTDEDTTADAHLDEISMENIITNDSPEIEAPKEEEEETTAEDIDMALESLDTDTEIDLDLEMEDLEDIINEDEAIETEETTYPSPEITATDDVIEEEIIEELEPQPSSNLASIDFPYLNETTSPKTTFNPNLFQKIPIDVSVELGRAEVTLKDIYELGEGSIIELRRFAGEQLDLIVNEQVIAKGEVVTIDNKYGLRINEISEQKPHL